MKSVVIGGDTYRVNLPKRSEAWLEEPTMLAPGGSSSAPIATSITVVRGESFLIYRWYIATTLVSLTVAGYEVIGRHPHRRRYLLGDDSRQAPVARVSAKSLLQPPRPPVYYHPSVGLSARVARVLALRHQTMASLRETPANNV